MSDQDYRLISCAPQESTLEMLEACIGLVRDGNAVDPGSAKREIHQAKLLAIALKAKQIVGVGVIKRVRTNYIQRITQRSGVDLPINIHELGYVAIDIQHQAKGLSHRIVEQLVTAHAEKLFATTSNDRMKKTLIRNGFVKKGNEWKGQYGIEPLSLWYRVF